MDLKTAIEETTSYLNVYKEKLKRGIKLTPENVKQIKTYTERAEEMKAEYQQKNDTLQELRIQLTMGKKGSVKVLGNAYRGVMIYISNQSYAVKDVDKHSWYKIADGVVKPTPF